MTNTFVSFVAACLIFVPVSEGTQANGRSDAWREMIPLPEDVAVGHEVYKIPATSPILALRLERGNEQGRFRFNATGGFIAVAGLLDYNVANSYELDVRVDLESAKDRSFLLSIKITDVSHWPPVYNETCAMPHRGFEQLIRLSKYYYPLDINFATKFTGTSGIMTNGIPLSLVVSEDKFTMDVNNDQCSVRMYWPDKRVGLYLFASMEPDDIHLIDCEVRKNHLTSLPRWKIYPNPMIERPDCDQIPDKWFSRPKQILNEALVKQYSSSYDTEWECNVSGLTLDILSFIIYINPAGCPFGKYGGKCQNDCICRNGATCHPFNGACKCGAGWQGPDCTIPKPELRVSSEEIRAHVDSKVRLVCTSYHYEVRVMEWYMRRSSDDELVKLHSEKTMSIVLEFPRAAEHHSGIYECHMTDVHNKIRVQTVSVTVKDCQSGFYSENCDRRCDCKNGATCDRTRGCVCLHGYYGPNCQHECRCRNNATCDKETGFCSCQKKHWGRECQNDCPCTEGADSCANETGRCICKDGWGGDFCEIRTSASPVDPYQNPIAFTTLLAGLICAVTIIGMVIACVVLYHRDKKRYGQMFIRSRRARQARIQQRQNLDDRRHLLPAMDEPGCVSSESDAEMNEDGRVFD
ncbi:uncharacterized protein [Ptychodera flava]|uniref:uncharacterized protein n=1 Tax=Ptychodera flava TaxID=63121 RepID=UPI00396A17EB